MLKSIAIAAVFATVSLPALAENIGNAPAPQDWQIQKRVPLKDGTTLNVYKDGKTSMENKFGRAVSMPTGQTMESADGKRIEMKGNEVLRPDMTNPLFYPGS